MIGWLSCGVSGLAALPVSGQERSETRPIDTFMRGFVEGREIVGASLAISYGGRLVYARGFGYADRERGRVVQPETRFRIASCSKPITAVTVLKLWEAGRLRLDESAFDLLGIVPHDGTPGDARLTRISVRHLLRHEGGWDRDRTYDPMFKTYWIGRQMGLGRPAEQREIIQYMLSEPLQFAPGSKYTYSNFGYQVLGRVIERRSGKSYEETVRRLILRPLGIDRMYIGHGPEERMARDEARYYQVGRSGQSPKAYKHRMQVRDANGGWVASAVELARFLTIFDTNPPVPLLSERSLELMLASRSKGGINLSHRGSLSDCCSSIMRRKQDGWSYVAFFNVYKDATGEKPTLDFDRELSRAVSKLEAWPTIDLFPRRMRAKNVATRSKIY